jgi:hypothetical protein
VYRATKDIKNSLLWNPNNDKLRNVEEDEAGRLAAFRLKFGESYDAKEEPKEESKTQPGQQVCKAMV